MDLVGEEGEVCLCYLVWEQEVGLYSLGVLARIPFVT
jgi:hypothetical protein